MKKPLMIFLILIGSVFSISVNPMTVYQQEQSLEDRLHDTDENKIEQAISDVNKREIFTRTTELENLKTTGIYDKDSSEVQELVEVINQLNFDDVLSAFGGRVSAGKLNQQAHVPVPEDKESVDRYQLDKSFQIFKKNSSTYVMDLLNNFSEYNTISSDQVVGDVKKDLDSLIIIKVYLDRWYGIEINEHSLSDKMYFKQKSNKDILEIAQKIKQNPKFLMSDSTGLRYRETLQPYYGFSNVSELVEGFINEETQSTDYDSWFHGYFKGTIYEISSKFNNLNISTWDKVKNNLNRTPSTNESKSGTDNLLLPLLTVEHSDGLVLGNAPGIIIYSSKKQYGTMVDNVMNQTLENFKNYFETIFFTHSEVQRNDMLQKIKTIPVYDSDLYEYEVNGEVNRKFNYLDESNILSHEFYLAIGYTANIASGSNAFASPQGISFAYAQINNGSGGTLAHEYNHSISHILLRTKQDGQRYGYRDGLTLETIPSRINNSPQFWGGMPWVIYESPKYADHTKDSLANSADRFQSPEDLQEYFGGYISLVNIMNQVVADVVLEMPLKEQIGYIRKWDANKEVVTSLDGSEIEALQLKNIDDLVDNNLALIDKSVSDGEPGEMTYGEAFYTKHSLYYADKNGDHLNKLTSGVEIFDSLMSMPNYKGWDAVQQFFSKATGVTSNLEAIRLVTGNPEMDFVKFKKMKLHENEDKLKSNGLKKHSYDDLVTLFKNNPTNFTKVKEDIYKQYLTETSEFKTTIFSDSIAPVETYSQFKLGYWNAKKYATIEGQAGIVDQRFESSNSVVKYVEVVDDSGKVRSSTKAVNTNWYDKKNYDGYQVQLGKAELENLSNGAYLLQVKIVFEDVEYIIPIKESLNSKSINSYSATINEINGYTIGRNFIDFSSLGGKCILKVHSIKEGMNKLFEYSDGKENRIYDGWINNDYNFNNVHTKELIIEDVSGKEVFNKVAGTWDVNKEYKLDVEESLAKSGFQISVPKKYKGASYRKFVLIRELGTEKGKYELEDK